MLGEVAELIDGYLRWVDYIKNCELIKIYEHYMNKNDGKYIAIWGSGFKQATFRRGVLHGVVKSWYNSGQIDSISHYRYGKRVGHYKSWYDSGQLEQICHYKHHKMSGSYKAWYRNGQLKLKIGYVNGHMHGKETYWYSDGRINYETYWINDVPQIG